MHKNVPSVILMSMFMIHLLIMIIPINILLRAATQEYEIAITDLYSDKVTYAPGEIANITAILCNNGSTIVTIIGQLRITKPFNAIVFQDDTLLSLNINECRSISFLFNTGNYDMVGFNATLYVYDTNYNLINSSYTVFDVASDWTKVARYGYVVDYNISNDTIAELVKIMATKYHVNTLMFYDWFEKYEDYTPDKDVYFNPLGKEVRLSAIYAWIENAHKWGIKAIAYVVGYAASEEFYLNHTTWALTDVNGNPYKFEYGNLYLMCPGDECPWHDYIIGEYINSIIMFGWDGIHIDHYGYPETAHNYFYGNVPLYMPEVWGNFTRDVKIAIKNLDKSKVVIFNSVNSDPWLIHTASNQDFVFIEMWEPKTYVRLGNILRDAKLWSDGHLGVVALYPSMRPSVLKLLWAEAISHRGTLTYSVQGEGIVGAPYIPQYPATTPETDEALLELINFMIYYEEFIYADKVSLSNSFKVDGLTESSEVISYKLTNGSYNAALILHMLNHEGHEAYWDRPTDMPKRLYNINVTVYIPANYTIDSIWYCRPGKESIELSFISTTMDTATFTLPEIDYYGMIVVLIKPNTSAHIFTDSDIAIITSGNGNDYTPILLGEYGYNIDVFDESNITRLWSNIYLYKAIVLGYRVLVDSPTIYSSFDLNRDLLARWISLGGALINSGDWKGVPLPIDIAIATNYDETGVYEERESISFTDPDHPIAKTPYRLNNSDLSNWNWSTGTWYTSYTGYTIIAVENTGGNPVIITRKYGLGKIALTTLEAGASPTASINGHNCPRLIRNMLEWGLTTDQYPANWGIAVITADPDDALPDILSKPQFMLMYGYDLYTPSNISTMNLSKYKLLLFGYRATDNSDIREWFSYNKLRIAEWIYNGGVLATTGSWRAPPLPPQLAVTTNYDLTGQYIEREEMIVTVKDHMLVRYPRDSLALDSSWSNWGWSAGTWFVGYQHYMPLVVLKDDPRNATLVFRVYGRGAIILSTLEISMKNHPKADPIANIIYYAFMPKKVALIVTHPNDDSLNMFSWTTFSVDIYSESNVEELIKRRYEYGVIVLGYGATDSPYIREVFKKHLNEIESFIWDCGMLISLGSNSAPPLHRWINATTYYEKTGILLNLNKFRFNVSYAWPGSWVIFLPNWLKESYFEDWGPTAYTYFAEYTTEKHGFPEGTWRTSIPGGWIPVILESETGHDSPVLLVNEHGRGGIIVLSTLRISYRGLSKIEVFENIIMGGRLNRRELSATSIFLSNWQDSIAIWMNSTLKQDQAPSIYGPRIAELRYAGNWSGNHIVDQSNFFRDETNKMKYTQISNFNAKAWIEETGILHSIYLSYGNEYTLVNISTLYVYPPYKAFYIGIIELHNPQNYTIAFNTLIMLHPNNWKKSSHINIYGWYLSDVNSIVFNMTSSGQFYEFIGLLNDTSTFSSFSYQVANDEDSNIASATCSPWFLFDSFGRLYNNSYISARDISGAFQVNITLSPGRTLKIAYFVGIVSNYSSVLLAINEARSYSVEYWLNYTLAKYLDWLNSGKLTDFTDEKLNIVYKRHLVVLKNVQNPTLGTIPASTNPSSYSYKVWVRDATFVSIALIYSGHYEEARKYLEWMASVQSADGSWHTCYDMWTGDWVPFVEPEWDFGVFAYAVYLYYLETGNLTFLHNMWSHVKAMADFLISKINRTNGLMGPDASIWEEEIEYNVFSQATSIAGLKSAAEIANILGYHSDRTKWLTAAAVITSSIQRSIYSDPPGLWNENEGYYVRALTTTGTVRYTVDSSSLALIIFGAIDPSSERASMHIKKIEQRLSHGIWGIARYEGDVYYYTSPYSPAGDEVHIPEPSWPTLMFWLEIAKILKGDNSTTMDRLRWYIERIGVGYSPPGEAISWITGEPVISTAIEPMPASQFIWVSLYYLGKIRSPILYEVYRDKSVLGNLSYYKTITISFGTAGDWPQWSDVPYLSDTVGDSRSSNNMTDIAKIYMANDDNNIYIRIDNSLGMLSAFNTEPKFAIHIVVKDLAGRERTYNYAFYWRYISENNASFILGRWSDSDIYAFFVTDGSKWIYDHAVTSIIAPQWDPSTGRIEVAVPISEITSTGAWSYGDVVRVTIVLVYHDPLTDMWIEDDMVTIDYIIASP